MTPPLQSGAAGPAGDAALAALGLALDDLAASLAAAAAGRGIDVVVLKGASLADWLWAGEVRPYGDCDLLVDPARQRDAEALLAERGFRPADPPAAGPGLHVPVARGWERGWERIDLHVSFWGIGVAPPEAWRILRGASERGALAGRTVRRLTVPARLLLVALHAVHHGDAPRPRADLARGIARGRAEDWAAAAALARELRAGRALAAALATSPEGTALARSLDLPRTGSLELAAALAGLGMSEGLERWARTPGLRARARLVRAEIVPRPAFMRWRYGVRRGELPAAYARRGRELAAVAGRLARARLAAGRRGRLR